MKKRINKFKIGAASFYVVAFSTLILVILATSFATATIAEITRTANDELSQSAYDSALAGVEDAKLAFMRYRECKRGGEDFEGVTCDDIINWVEDEDRGLDCDMVAHILGRIDKNDSGEVLIKETRDGDNGLEQAYTCVMLRTNLSDVQVTLNEGAPYHIIDVDLDSHAKNVKYVKINWYMLPEDQGSETLAFNNFYSPNDMGVDGKVVFKSLNDNDGEAIPPTIAVQLLQTTDTFSFADLNAETTEDGRTDRATVFLVPTNVAIRAATGTKTETYEGVYDADWNVVLNRAEGENRVTAEQVASTNNRMRNVPYLVYCNYDDGSQYVCSATLELPLPIGGNRSDDTFMFVVSLPYETPPTVFSMEFICLDDGGGSDCGNSGEIGGEGASVIELSDEMQIMIDSTGRANDLYRRVQMRLEPGSGSLVSFSPFYAVELLGKKSGAGEYSLDKSQPVIKEWGL